MPDYRSRLFDTDDRIQLPVPHIKARGWTAQLRGITPTGILQGTIEQVVTKADREHYSCLVETLEFTNTHLTNRYAPEVVISAPGRVQAQQAQNLISATAALLFATTSFENLVVVPSDGKKEGMRDDEIKYALGSSAGTAGFWRATKIAARATERTRWKYAAAKYLASLKSCSVHPMEHHPRAGSYFGIEKDPVEIVTMAQAIALGYAVIEELGLEIRASQTKPSKIDGHWNEPVLSDINQRLARSKIVTTEGVPWMVRGTPRRIERKNRPPVGEKLPWTQRNIRDRKFPLVDAINYASMLRSKAAAHASGILTRSLTMVDVANVQDLARRLALETLGAGDVVQIVTT